MESRSSRPRNVSFPFGQLVATPGALQAIPILEFFSAFQRHLIGDWGALDAEDWKANDRALIDGTRLFSVYESVSGIRFWIITEADRSVTTVLLPSEY